MRRHAASQAWGGGASLFLPFLMRAKGWPARIPTLTGLGRQRSANQKMRSLKQQRCCRPTAALASCARESYGATATCVLAWRIAPLEKLTEQEWVIYDDDL
jgi:hypothetical protein